MSTFLPIAYFENQFVQFESAQLSIATHALHYGTGAVGGIRGYPLPHTPNAVGLFRLDRHCKRLSQSAAFLHWTLSITDIQETLIEWVKRNRPIQPFYIRPLIYSSGLGIAPRLHDIEQNWLIYGLPLGDLFPDTGITCRTSSWTRQADMNAPLRGKLSAAYITSALAKTEAVDSGFDDAILLNQQGKVSEASGMNIFLVRDGQLITPSVDQDILEGITRDSVLAIAQALSIPTIERPVDRSELIIADELFLCGTAAKIGSVRQIDNYELPADRPITLKLKQTLDAVVTQTSELFPDWMTVVSWDASQ